jgi:hypothetical protein
MVVVSIWLAGWPLFIGEKWRPREPALFSAPVITSAGLLLFWLVSRNAAPPDLLPRQLAEFLIPSGWTETGVIPCEDRPDFSTWIVRRKRGPHASSPPSPIMLFLSTRFSTAGRRGLDRARALFGSERFGGQFPKTLEVILGKMAEIAEAAGEGH